MPGFPLLEVHGHWSQSPSPWCPLPFLRLLQSAQLLSWMLQSKGQGESEEQEVSPPPQLNQSQARRPDPPLPPCQKYCRFPERSQAQAQQLARLRRRGWGPGGLGRHVTRKASLGNTWAQQRFEYYRSSVRLLTEQSFLPIFAVSWGRIRLSFLFPGTFLQKEKKMEMLGLQGEGSQSKNKDNEDCNQQKTGECVCGGRGRAVWRRAGVTVRLSERPGPPPAELSRGSSLPTGGTRGSSGGGLWSAGRSPVPPSLKVVAALGQVCGGSSPPLPSSCLQSSGCACKPPLGQRIDGVDWRRGLRALVALRLLLVLLDRVLADEGAVLVELALPALAVVHQAVVALLLLDGAVQGRLAALQGLVVLVTARGETADQSQPTQCRSNPARKGEGLQPLARHLLLRGPDPG